MLEIIYQDEAFIAVNKPTGMLSVPGRGPDKQDCCLARVQAEFPEALMVHRLDMDTSGLMLFARSLEVQRNLSLQFEKREIHKTYVAIVEGVIEKEVGRIDFPMRKDMEQRLPPKHIVDCVRGKKAVTEWQVLERTATTTRLALFPQTGRSHQLRVHMQSIGHPIVGDNIYGTAAERLMLHAQSLEMRHPLTGEPIRLECPATF
ncbi:Ribosomal large subunit pseudouridine synthase A [Pontiella desulfatans]|uniref:Ribosomal large subunit pseudouridine synthase A n=1 Tax=Pontiella desulfatans TaxID=2750659 RepID=A0A6C2UE62_PONDE|nr:RluA family pseudouridine synthase [Pontiella desulfatans]VGO17827.1 Ribosomal large subunit pseudouridine synthase A [Pontiella desulfatans]